MGWGPRWVGGKGAQHSSSSAGQVTRCYFEDGYLDTPVYLLEELSWDHTIPGPSILIDKNRCRLRTPGSLPIAARGTWPGGWSRELGFPWLGGGGGLGTGFWVPSLSLPPHSLRPGLGHGAGACGHWASSLSTILIEPDCTATLTRVGDICIAVGSGTLRPVGPELNAVQLSIFSHRFMSIAGECCPGPPPRSPLGPGAALEALGTGGCVRHCTPRILALLEPPVPQSPLDLSTPSPNRTLLPLQPLQPRLRHLLSQGAEEQAGASGRSRSSCLLYAFTLVLGLWAGGGTGS